MSKKKVLSQIVKENDIHNIAPADYRQLAKEIRAKLVRSVSRTGGHLASNLGAVELTVAIHRVFDPASDRLVFDVGHQCYVHKALTGRRELFGTLRQLGGLSGFPKPWESPHDAFIAGHASNSVSVALGMARARTLQHQDYQVMALIGDGALTGGLAYEGLNNVGASGEHMIVLLNDNGMSIDPNVGALPNHLSKLRSKPAYYHFKKWYRGLFGESPSQSAIYRFNHRLKTSLKKTLWPGSTLFEDMGFTYLGPIDGHDLPRLCDMLTWAKELTGPVVVHVHTQKGKGYAFAERDPGKFHGIAPFDPETGLLKKAPGETFSSVFGKTLSDCAGEDSRICAITAAMEEGTGLTVFEQAHPERFFDVGIAEEHAVTLAAGLAAAGKKPVVALYSTFAQRAYDQILHDVCLQKLPVVLALDRAGLVGQDGPTHHGVFDYSYLRPLPNMTVMAPKDEAELRDMLATALSLGTPVALRYPRGRGVGVPLREGFSPLTVGRAEILRAQGSVALLAVGSMVPAAEQAAEQLEADGISARVANMRFIKPLDAELLLRWAHDEEVRVFVTIEENMLAGGFGSAVLETLADENALLPILRLGIGDTFVEQGTREELLALCGLTPQQIAARVEEFWKGLDD